MAMHILYPSNQSDICESILVESDCTQYSSNVIISFKPCLWINHPPGYEDVNCISSVPESTLNLSLYVVFIVILTTNILSIFSESLFAYLDLPTEGYYYYYYYYYCYFIDIIIFN